MDCAVKCETGEQIKNTTTIYKKAKQTIVQWTEFS